LHAAQAGLRTPRADESGGTRRSTLLKFVVGLVALAEHEVGKSALEQRLE